jgi:DNA repair exonuclease SbcCD ATPase subunit
MSIKLGEFIFENFNSYYGIHKISFKERQGNLVSIRGIDEFDKSSNGSGKSTIPDALTFTIFGRSLKKELNLDDLVNKKADYLKTSLSFEDSSDGVVKAEYKIERTRSKSPMFSQCALYENGKCISSSLTNTETQNKIEQLIGLNFSTFVNNNVLNPELFKFIKGNNTQKVDILERVLNLNIVSKIFATLTNIVREDQLIFSKNNTEYYALKTTLENLRQQEEYVNKNVQENINLSKKRNEEISNEIKILKNDREKYEKIVTDLYLIVDEKQQKINHLDKQRSNLDHEIENSKKNIKYYETNEKCHYCKQPIQNREQILNSEKEKLSSFLKKVNDYILEIETIKVAPEFNEYAKAVEAADLCTKKIKELDEETKQNVETIKRFESLMSEEGKVDEITKKLLNTEVEWLDSKEKLEISEFWRELLTPKSKTRMSLAADLIKILNLNIQKYVSNFYNKNVQLKFDIVENNINETIFISGEEFKYDQLSSGEKQKVDIVIVLSLLDIAMTYFKNNRLKFLIIDEATDHLDNVWARYVIEFIKQYAIHLNMMCLFISHHSIIDEVSNLFDNEIIAVKGLDGNSYIAKNRIQQY